MAENDLWRYLRDKRADGGLFHLYALRKIERRGLGVLYRKMDWMNAELSHALLVFRAGVVRERAVVARAPGRTGV